ncbi:MAG: flagellar motor switch protein FliN [Oscillospiraceae bacterium]|jgi:flagellar motor switch protein FliN/FliY|nr:flagellar motor switch protein FliN [Oscillospiraceae bacterium]
MSQTPDEVNDTLIDETDAPEAADLGVADTAEYEPAPPTYDADATAASMDADTLAEAPTDASAADAPVGASAVDDGTYLQYDTLAAAAAPRAVPRPGSLVDVHPMRYPAFDGAHAQDGAQKDMELVYDIPLQVTVELGRTKKEVSEILEFGIGTVIILDKIAGDPVEILVNGKLIARGEVVVIDENYGVRVTEIINR